MKYVCIPSYNPDPEFFVPLLYTLQIAKLEGVIDEAVIINDGSNEEKHWFDLAQGLELKVLHSPKNEGKTSAAYTGINFGAEKGFSKILLSDDDMIDLTPDKIMQAFEALKTNETSMTRSRYTQGEQICPFSYSGFRAINLDVLKAWFSEEHKDFEKWNEAIKSTRWGLELALDILVPKENVTNLEIPNLASGPRNRRGDLTYMHNDRALLYTRLIELGLVQK